MFEINDKRFQLRLFNRLLDHHPTYVGACTSMLLRWKCVQENTLAHIHTHTPSYNHTQIHINTHTHTLAHYLLQSHTYIHKHKHTLPPSLTHALPPTHTHSHTILTLPLSYARTHPSSHTPTLPHTQT